MDANSPLPTPPLGIVPSIFVRALPVLGQKPSGGTQRAAIGKSLTHRLNVVLSDQTSSVKRMET
jgi:hypothetical protein